MQETFLLQNIYIFLKYIKSVGRATLGTFRDISYFSRYLQTKETAWERGDAIFLKPEMIWSSLGWFKKAPIKIKQIKHLMALSPTIKKLSPIECLGNFSGCLVIRQLLN